MENNLLHRITINPEICHGKPTIRGTRHMVLSILEYLAGGDTTETLLAEFEDLEKEDIIDRSRNHYPVRVALGADCRRNIHQVHDAPTHQII